MTQVRQPGAEPAEGRSHPDGPAGVVTPPPLFAHLVGVPHDATIVEALAPVERARLELRGEIVISDAIGRGGTAIVNSAEQRSLEREVAVKRVRPDRDADAALRLVREARVMASLDHPNVIPVHLIGVDEDGQPVIVMKRIKGRAWRTFVREDGALSAPEAGDPLEWHLRVLMQVARAAHYAHEQGVLHRDIKLDNVMVERSGGVFLVDWDLAAALRPGLELEIPEARLETEVVGTPSCMAPEMALVQSDLIGPRTDVFLLGACLHTILTGQPRHCGETVVRKLYAAARSSPVTYAHYVPRSLAEIANRATASDPAARYESADAFRQAVASYLQHRGALRLCDAAEARLRELEALVGSEDPAERQRLHRRVGEALFGFRQALAEWPECEVARQGLRRVRIAGADHELRSGEPDRAAVLLAEVEDPPPSLLERLDVAHEEAARDASERRRLERLGRDVDARVGQSVRASIMITMGAVQGLLFAALAVLHRLDIFTADYETFAVLIAAHAVGVGAMVFGYRGVMDANAFNRRFALTLAFQALALLMLWPMAMTMGVPLEHAIALMCFTLMVSCVTAVVSLDLRFLTAAVLFGVTATLTVLHPDLRFEALAVCTAAAWLFVGIGWHHDQRQRAQRRGRRAGLVTAHHRRHWVD